MASANHAEAKTTLQIGQYRLSDFSDLESRGMFLIEADDAVPSFDDSCANPFPGSELALNKVHILRTLLGPSRKYVAVSKTIAKEFINDMTFVEDEKVYTIWDAVYPSFSSPEALQFISENDCVLLVDHQDLQEPQQNDKGEQIVNKLALCCSQNKKNLFVVATASMQQLETFFDGMTASVAPLVLSLSLKTAPPSSLLASMRSSFYSLNGQFSQNKSAVEKNEQWNIYDNLDVLAQAVQQTVVQVHPKTKNPIFFVFEYPLIGHQYSKMLAGEKSLTTHQKEFVIKRTVCRISFTFAIPSKIVKI